MKRFGYFEIDFTLYPAQLSEFQQAANKNLPNPHTKKMAPKGAIFIEHLTRPSNRKPEYSKVPTACMLQSLISTPHLSD